MNRHELTTDTALTVEQLNETIRAALMLGKPGEAADYTQALRDAAAAYDSLDTQDDD